MTIFSVYLLDYICGIGVLFLDDDVMISCQDVHFSLTVWQSSQNSLVGFYPRMHRTVQGKDSKKRFEFLDYWMFVWYHKYYTMILPAGMVISTKHVEVS